MSFLYMDGFGHYDTAQISDKWRGGKYGDVVIDTTPGRMRTGRACLRIRSGAFGPIQLIPHTVDLLIATNWSSDSGGTAGSAGMVLLVQNFDSDVGWDATCVQMAVRADGTLDVYNGPFRTLLGSTAPGLVALNNTYNSIAIKLHCSRTAGTVVVWINGVEALNLTGVNTAYRNNPLREYYNGFQLMGNGGIPLCFHADVYVLDCAVEPHTTFLGALRIIADTPTSDAAVAWTPLSGSNFSNVDEIPPDGDTSYNSSGTIGQIDQYEYPGSGIPADSTIFGVQHVQDMKVDSGARTVASDFEGQVGAANALSGGYVMYWVPYDVNPGTGLPFVQADFPVEAGPKVTA